MLKRAVLLSVFVAGVGALAACGHNTEQKAASGAVAGAVVAGPVGAAVGGAAGAATQAVEEKDKGKPK
jgi:hypothetical protein